MGDTLFSIDNLSSDIVPLMLNNTLKQNNRTDISWFATYLNHQIMNTQYIVNERAILEKMKKSSLKKLYEYLEKNYRFTILKLENEDWDNFMMDTMNDMIEYGKYIELNALE